MPEESFMLINLKEKQSKKLAQVMSNDTCREILDYLANKEYVTETKLSKDLKIPLSTVHYNLKALNKSGLVLAEEFHYSEKGKEVPHYKLANKFIIIAPKSDEKAIDKIKRFWPISVFALVGAAAIEIIQRLFSQTGGVLQENSMLAAKTAPMAADMVEEAVLRTAEATPIVQEVVHTPIHSPLSLWFLGGAFFVILVLVLWELVRKK